MSGHIGLREEMSAGRVLAQQIAQLFARSNQPLRPAYSPLAAAENPPVRVT